MNDVIALLADANPVRAEDIAGLEFRAHTHRPALPRRVVVAAILATAVAASLLAVLLSGGAGSRTRSSSGESGHGGGPSPAQTPISLSDAAAALGASVILPDTSAVAPSDVGSVTKRCPGQWGKTCEITITFPSEDVQIHYSLGGYADPLTEYEGSTRADGTALVYLSGIPALLDTGEVASWIEFQLNGLSIWVMERHSDGPAVQAIAQSIVDRSAPLDTPTGIDLLPVTQPWRRIPLRMASTTLGAPLVLPRTPLTGRPGEVHADGKCRPGCLISIVFPTKRLSVLYERGTFISVGELATKVGGAGRLITLNGVPGLLVNVHGPSLSWIDLVLNGTRIVVSGHRNDASLKAIAESIVDRSRSQR